MSLLQTVRAASSCLISWLQAAAYQAFSGKGRASVIVVLHGCRMYTDEAEEQSYEGISRAISLLRSSKNGQDHVCCIHIRKKRRGVGRRFRCGGVVSWTWRPSPGP